MANPEHVEALRQGADVWNEWREAHPQEEPDFSYENFYRAELRGANLQDANLSTADFGDTDLSGADLSGAYLHYTDLSKADLAKAVLTEANLDNTNFHHSNLRSTDLSFASLVQTNFCYADLQRANLFKAELGGTLFGSTNLTAATGLDTCNHQYGSVLDVQTLQLSGKLPINFLRGCGLSETFIEYIPSLLNDPLQFYSCFISYSSKDHHFAERLHADLQNKGVRCWFAPEDLKIGDRFRDRIDESIRLHDKLLIILSRDSVSSQWVGNEVEAAFEREGREERTVLFPIKIDEAVTESDKAWAATIRRARHVGDFCGWKDHDSYQKAFDRLLRDLKAEEK